MIKAAMQYLLNISKPETVEVNGIHYSDKSLYEVEPTRHYPSNLTLSTLTSFTEYINNNKDNIDLENAMVIVSGYREVNLMTNLDDHMKRSLYISTISKTPQFNFGCWHDKEDFMIALQSLFCDAGDRQEILRILGTMKEENVKTSSDDGVSQSVVTKKGIALGENEVIPNPVSLAPYRTFVEIDQPISKFVFRINDEGRELRAGLFEADGGIWKLTAIERIKEYLRDNIEQPIEILG